ncbi:hypothetical protein CBR_g16001 [Chara braunii]|uniref:Protein kinase domain-containing protein n=1 Tax=Chara braunii TaxID=69332 RepID=A0A388JSW9_CHABU|nr:hypothetical protein CBR_g16001 [Chara braunii]|eukprot:GBG60880.1 hypothetical protein CBR_g16001 [Chara braunii]
MRRPPLWAIVTEYLDGLNLYDFIHEQRDSPLDLRIIVSKGLDIARGMDYLHSRQIVHRALKPQNLVMDSDGVVKVTEFGPLRMDGDPESSMDEDDLEDDGYRWMAPELIGHRPHDHKVDVYSFGIIMWELLTGLIPFDGLPTVQAAVSIVNKNTRPELPDACPASLRAMITECWSPDPEKRPEFSSVVRTLEAELSSMRPRERSLAVPAEWLREDGKASEREYGGVMGPGMGPGMGKMGPGMGPGMGKMGPGMGPGSRYGEDGSRDGSRYGEDRSRDGSRYGEDGSREGSRISLVNSIGLRFAVDESSLVNSIGLRFAVDESSLVNSIGLRFAATSLSFADGTLGRRCLVWSPICDRI